MENDLFLRHVVGTPDVVPAKRHRPQTVLPFLANVKNSSGARAEQPFVRVGSHEVGMVEGRRESTGGLDAIDAESDPTLAQKAADALDFNAPAGDEVAGWHRHEPRVF